MSGRERQLWTEFVRKREERKDGKLARKREPGRARCRRRSSKPRSMISPERRRKG